MITVRVPADLVPVLGTERRFDVQPGHPLAAESCPVCDQPLGGLSSLTPRPVAVVLVFVGIAQEDRKDAGWTNGAAVAVHEKCAGVQR